MFRARLDLSKSFFSTLTNSFCSDVGLLYLWRASVTSRFALLHFCKVQNLLLMELCGSEKQVTARIKSVSHRDLLRRNVFQVFYLSSRVRSPRRNDGVLHLPAGIAHLAKLTRLL